ncbi:hypothetical protein LIMNO130_30872 [Limnobacter sp. 130]|jgi:hypothetical protein|nr:hypothetical protein LIMNO130_30872 [Limnobacter sp. 130]
MFTTINIDSTENVNRIQPIVQLIFVKLLRRLTSSVVDNTRLVVKVKLNICQRQNLGPIQYLYFFNPQLSSNL